jgi:hypothetical protein
MKVKFHVPLFFVLAGRREGHKSQTRLIFKNTYGDAFNVRTKLSDANEFVIDYFLMLVEVERGLNFHVNLRSPLNID